MDELSVLREEIVNLQSRISFLENELEFLKAHPVFVQGLKGERIVAKLTGGVLTEFAAAYDVTVGECVKIEVKFSKLNSPNPPSMTRRWNWSKLLGWKDKGKDFDFLLLVGEKDMRFADQYPDKSPYVYFLIPRQVVANILSSNKTIGSQAQIVTNLANVRSPASCVIKNHMVSEVIISALSNREPNI